MVISLEAIIPDAPPKDTQLLQSINGYLVDFPQNFLEEEQMSPSIFDKEFVVPRSVFL